MFFWILEPKNETPGAQKLRGLISRWHKPINTVLLLLLLLLVVLLLLLSSSKLPSVQSRDGRYKLTEQTVAL